MKRIRMAACCMVAVPLLAGCPNSEGGRYEETVQTAAHEAAGPQPLVQRPSPQPQADATGQGGTEEGRFGSVDLPITFAENDMRVIQENGYTVTVSLYDKATGEVVRDADGMTTQRPVDTDQLPSVRYAVDKVPAGAYQLRVIVTDGKDRTWIVDEDIYIH